MEAVIGKSVCPYCGMAGSTNKDFVNNHFDNCYMKRNVPIDDVFIYKIGMVDVCTNEESMRFVLARDFNDAVQLACEMCEGNDLSIIQTTEIGYVDYCTKTALGGFR